QLNHPTERLRGMENHRRHHPSREHCRNHERRETITNALRQGTRASERTLASILVEEEIGDGEVRIVDHVRAIKSEEPSGDLGVVEADDRAKKPRDRKEDERGAADEQKLDGARTPAAG